MCDLALTVENEKSIIHLSLDMLIADFVSTNIILHDLETFYENPDLIIVPTTLYRDVVLYQNQKRTIKTVERNVAEKYWSDKIPSMGEAPDLPLKDDYALDNAKFMQKKVFLNHDMWMSFVENARKFKVTPSILIMASFAEVLGLWSSNNKFCINTTILNRPKVLNVTEIKTLKDSFEIPAIEKDYDRPAYIIFTSGTTGEPKGVIITHRAAMNTICNINQKYNITERDVFFGLANLSFDLSVYDIFGCYQVGGTLVLPDSSSIKDPKQLTELLVVHGVTVWNSVPAQMQMVINYMENSKVNSDIELRVVLLSGDWIPVNLPKKIYEKFNKSRVVSLGGATEASIWSIYYDIQREDDFEKSIPYGYPLANQKFYVLNENLQSCPDYVVGSLYIAGVGLSAGYLNDEKLNQEKYKYLPETGEKIYKTGDIGCYTRDGIILFKGREAGDEQVKIHGHRVELAEIRSVLNEHPLVESSVVLAMGESAEDLHINAVVAPVKKKELTSIHITNAEKENLEKLEKYYEEEIDQDLFERWINKSEEVVTSDIFNTETSFFT